MPTFKIFNDMYVHIDVDIYGYILVRFDLAKLTPQIEPNHLLSACEIL